MEFLLLAGDIGGTNTRLTLWRYSERGRKVFANQAFRNRKYESLTAVVQDFLSTHSVKTPPQKACFAVAGPVDRKNNICVLTNLNWHLDGSLLAQQLQIDKVFLINDFEAVGYGITQLPKTGFRPLQAGADPSSAPSHAPIGVIGAGTGLGQAFIIRERHGDRFSETVYPTEGGHVDFAAQSATEFSLLQYFQKYYGISHVSADRVVSGPGIVVIYKYLRSIDKYRELPEIAEAVNAWEMTGSSLSQAPTQIISETAFSGRNSLCDDSMRLFVKLYGAEVGNFALKLLPHAGLYVAGGIAPKIFSAGGELEKLFLEAIKDKGRMQPLIEKLPIYLVTDESVGLIGAARFAATNL